MIHKCTIRMRNNFVIMVQSDILYFSKFIVNQINIPKRQNRLIPTKCFYQGMFRNNKGFICF